MESPSGMIRTGAAIANGLRQQAIAASNKVHRMDLRNMTTSLFVVRRECAAEPRGCPANASPVRSIASHAFGRQAKTAVFRELTGQLRTAWTDTHFVENRLAAVLVAQSRDLPL